MKGKLMNVISFVLVVCFCTELVYAESYTDEISYEEVYTMYKDDPQFLSMKADYGDEYAEEFLNDVLERLNQKNVSRGGGGNVCYEYVKNIQQTETYNCGMTTVLQTLYGLDSADSVPGDSDAEKIEYLDEQYNVDEQGSTYVYQVRNALNKYNEWNSTYIYLKANNIASPQHLLGYIADSLTYCKPVILHANTKGLKYYDGKESGHYISVDYIDRTTQKARVVDCNYDDEYYGIHNDVSIEELYECIVPKDEDGDVKEYRYLIY